MFNIYENLGNAPRNDAKSLIQESGADDDFITSEDKDNLKPAAQGSAFFWLGLFFLYILWGIIQKISITENIQKNVIKANAHNLMLIGLGAIIFKNFGNIMLSKIVKWNIPFLSRIAGGLLPLFRA